MINPRIRFERVMKQAMKYVITTGELPNISDANRECIACCIDKGFMSGVKTFRPASGTPKFDTQHPKITELGLQWLYPKWDKKFVVSSVIAISSIAINIIQFIC